jgi:hypothetical protein
MDDMNLYRHKNGAAYVLLHTATHSETMEQVVVYKALYGDGKVWCRPHDMFMDGRFTRIDTSDLTEDEYRVMALIREPGYW